MTGSAFATGSTAGRAAVLIGVLAGLAVLAACGAPAGSGQQDEAATQAGSTLTVRVSPKPEASPKVWTLTCQPPGGSHPAPEAACAALRGAASPFATPSTEQVCTQIYGGPQTAKIEGEWRGTSVSTDYSRRNGCAIQTWDALEPVFQPTADPTTEPTEDPAGDPRKPSATP